VWNAGCEVGSDGLEYTYSIWAWLQILRKEWLSWLNTNSEKLNF
jgi:hypothetical protein